MIRLLHTADVQIDATMPELGQKADSRRRDLLYTFEHLVALAIREHVHLFLVSGNLFATPRPDEAALQRVSAALRRLTARGILPVLLPGDCDGMITPDSVYFRDAFKNMLVLDGRDPASPVTVRLSGRTIHLYGFSQRGEQPLPPENLRLDEEGSHVALICLSSQLHVEPALLERMAGWGMDYIACAPSHQWQVIEGHERIFGCAPGSPEGFAAPHNGDRFVAVVQLEGDSLHIERRRANRRRQEDMTLDLARYATAADLQGAILEGSHPDLLRRVVLTGIPRFTVNVSSLQKACADSFFHLDIRDRSAVLDGEVAGQVAEQPTYVGEFMRRARQMAAELSRDEAQLVEDAAREVLAARAELSGGGHETA